MFGVGEDYSRATTITPGPNQSIPQRDLDTTNDDTFWVQDQNHTTPSAGSQAVIDDTAPTGDTWNLAVLEFLPSGT